MDGGVGAREEAAAESVGGGAEAKVEAGGLVLGVGDGVALGGGDEALGDGVAEHFAGEDAGARGGVPGDGGGVSHEFRRQWRPYAFLLGNRASSKHATALRALSSVAGPSKGTGGEGVGRGGAHRDADIRSTVVGTVFS